MSLHVKLDVDEVLVPQVMEAIANQKGVQHLDYFLEDQWVNASVIMDHYLNRNKVIKGFPSSIRTVNIFVHPIENLISRLVFFKLLVILFTSMIIVISYFTLKHVATKVVATLTKRVVGLKKLGFTTRVITNLFMFSHITSISSVVIGAILVINVLSVVLGIIYSRLQFLVMAGVSNRINSSFVLCASFLGVTIIYHVFYSAFKRTN